MSQNHSILDILGIKDLNIKVLITLKLNNNINTGVKGVLNCHFMAV